MYWPQQIAQEDFRQILADHEGDWALDEERHGVVLAKESLRYRLPMIWPSPERGEVMADYLARIPEEEPAYTIVIVQLGAAAIGHMEHGECVAHKAIKKYMKRHKRGKAQIQYLNTRGKSKAGSRVRLANTERFFEEINERLADWLELYDAPSYLLVSCTPNVWGMMFQADPPPPFEKKDPRIRRIPYDIPIPDFEQLTKIREKLIHAQRIDDNGA